MSATDLPIARPHRAGCGPRPGVPAEPRSRRGRWRALVLVAVHVAIAAHLVHATRGRTLGPLEPSEAGRYWTEGVLDVGLILLVLLIVSTLLLGRFFCGWGCHVVALQDGSAWLLGKLGLRPRPIRSRLLVFVPLFAALEIFLLPGLLHGAPEATRWELTTESFFDRFPGPWMTLVTFVTVGFAAVWILGAKGFCTYGCPYGALFSIADRFSRGRIRVNDACEGCGHCTAVCTSNVAVHREVRDFGMVVDPGCMKCTDCVSACPKDALRFDFGPLPDRAARRDAAKRTYDFSWPEEIAMVVVFVVAGLLVLRGLYGIVPFLLAVTLGVFAALAVVVTWRLLTRGTVVFQGRVLKASGRPTARGALAGVVLLAGLGFLVHSGWLKLELRRVGAALEAGSGPAAVLDHLERAERLALLPYPGLDFEIGRQSELSGDPRAALASYERATRRFPSDLEAWRGLVRTRDATGDVEGACRATESLLDRMAASGRRLDAELVARLLPDVKAWSQAVPDSPGPALLIVRLLLIAELPEAALEQARAIAELFPDDPRVKARLMQAEAAAPGAR